MSKIKYSKSSTIFDNKIIIAPENFLNFFFWVVVFVTVVGENTIDIRNLIIFFRCEKRVSLIKILHASSIASDHKPIRAR